VFLAITESDGTVTFVVEDDGRGFDVAQVQARPSGDQGLGLAALDERAKMLGGSLHIQSRQGAGTRVACTIPGGRKNG
jgi:signal transduction histidine kinase